MHTFAHESNHVCNRPKDTRRHCKRAGVRGQANWDAGQTPVANVLPLRRHRRKSPPIAVASSPSHPQRSGPLIAGPPTVAARSRRREAQLCHRAARRPRPCRTSPAAAVAWATPHRRHPPPRHCEACGPVAVVPEVPLRAFAKQAPLVSVDRWPMANTATTQSQSRCVPRRYPGSTLPLRGKVGTS